MTKETLQEKWIKRADEILTDPLSQRTSEAVQCATSMISAFYGPESSQMRVYRATMEVIARQKDGQQHELQMNALGTVKNIKAEILAGLTNRVRALVAGEILTELVALAKETLAERQNPEAAKNIGAVLVASAFEDLLRRMGSEFAGIIDRPKLEKVINILKEKELLKGGEPAMAQGHLKFRNDSLHADWNQVQRSQVDGCLAFVESLLGKHFS